MKLLLWANFVLGVLTGVLISVGGFTSVNLDTRWGMLFAVPVILTTVAGMRFLDTKTRWKRGGIPLLVLIFFLVGLSLSFVVVGLPLWLMPR